MRSPIKAIQGNFDHLMGQLRMIGVAHNKLDQIVEDLVETVDEDAQHSHDADGVPVSHADLTGVTSDQHHAQSHTHASHTGIGTDDHHNKVHTHVNAGEGGTVSHDDLTGVSVNDHHAQAHDQGDHNAAEVGDLVAVAATADAGTSVEVPNADHRHAHGSGYAGGHTDSATDHGALTGLADDDHPQYATNAEFDDHSARHADGGADEVLVESLPTAETDTDLRLAPDGAGGVEWGTGGAGGSALEVLGAGVSIDTAVESIDFQPSNGFDVSAVGHDVTVLLDPTEIDHTDLAGGDTDEGQHHDAAHDLDSHTDVALGSPAVGTRDVLAFDGSDWVNGRVYLTPSGQAAPPTNALSVEDVTDSDPDDGDLLTWDEATDSWIAAPPSSGASTTTRSWYISPSMGELDDAALANVDATPDLAVIWNFTEASNRSGVYFNTAIPLDWDSGTVELFIWWVTSTASGTVRWIASVSELAVGDSPTEVSDKLAENITDVADSTTVKKTSLGTFTPTAAGDPLKVNLERHANAAADTATGAARVLMVEFRYTATTPPGPTGPSGAGSSIIVQEGDSTVVAAATTLDFGTGFDISEAPAGEANVTLDLSEAVINDLGNVSGSPSTGDTLIYDGSGWIPDTSTSVPDHSSGSVLFGNGADGAADFDGTASVAGIAKSGSTYTLVKDLYLTSLYVRNTYIVITSGFRIFVNGLAQIDSGGILHNDGGNGGTPTAGTAGAGGTLDAAGAGAAGRSTAGVGANATSPVTVAAGGNGSNGGSAGANAGGTGATAQKPTAANGGVENLNSAVGAINFATRAFAGIKGGAGGGAGGVGATTATSGGGGGGGGSILLVARIVINNGSIHANGGNGGNGSATTGSSGGGGGGGGGCVVIVTRNYSGSGTTTATEGSPGNGAGGGNNGATGGVDGIVVYVDPP